VLLELTLRVFHYGPQLDLFLPSKEVHGYLITNPAVSMRYFSQERETNFGSIDAFSEIKKENALRIFVLGGSTTAGYPYFFNGSFSKHLSDRLIHAYPDYDVEVVNLGMTAVSSYTVRDFARECLKYDPDLFIIYAGHNEFYGALGSASAQRSIFGTNRSLNLAYLELKQLKIFNLMRSLVSFISKSSSSRNERDFQTLMARMVRDQAIPIDSPVYQNTMNNFKENISDIIKWAQNSHVPVLVGTLSSNIKDQPPFVSIHKMGLNDKIFNKELENAQQLMNNGRYSQALNILKGLIKKDSGYALTYFYAGECARQLGDYQLAKTYYTHARDLDGLRFRASGDINKILRKLSQQDGVYLSEVEGILEKTSSHGLIGNELMLEHLHPNLEGYFLIGKAFAQTVLTQNLLIHASGRQLPPQMPSKSDSDFRKNMAVTPLDLRMAEYQIEILTSGWPFQNHRRFKTIADFKTNTKLDEIALDSLNKKLNYWQAHLAMADYYQDIGDIDSAIRECSALIRAFPQYWKSYKAMARTLITAKRFDDALPLLLKVTEMADDAFSFRWAGTAMLVKNKPEKAIPFLEKSLNLTPDDYRARYNLGVAYFSTGNRDRAVIELERVLKYKPDFQYAKDLLGQLK
jgi:tetratricopeptide (TPR) repeat protein